MSDLFLPVIDVVEDENNQAVVTGNETLDFDTRDQIKIDDSYTIEPEAEKQQDQSSTNLRRSARIQQLSFKFLSHFQESDSD